jgi:hypothetical protein
MTTPETQQGMAGLLASCGAVVAAFSLVFAALLLAV